MEGLKKILAIGVLLLLLMISGSHFMFVRFVKSQKHHFRAQVLKSGSKEVFAFTMPSSALYKDIKGLEWKDEGKELVLNGIYHEIVKITCENGIATVLLIPDELENQLFSDYFSLRKHDAGSLPGTLLYFMGILYFQELNDSLCVMKEVLLQCIQRELSFNLSSYTEKIIKPPLFRIF